MGNSKNKKSVKFQGDMLNFCDFIQVFVFIRNHHLKMGLSFISTINYSRPLNEVIANGVPVLSTDLCCRPIQFDTKSIENLVVNITNNGK